MDNFLPFPYYNANSFEELPMDLNNNSSYFSTIPAYDHHHQYHQAQPHHFYPPYQNVAWPVEQTAMMNHQMLQYSPEVFAHQIPIPQTGSEFGSLVCNPGWRQERGGFLDPHMSKMARINRKNAMMRARNNPGSSSTSNELVDSRRQVAFTMKNYAETDAEKDFYLYTSFDNKMLRVLLVKHLKNSDVGSLGRIVLPKREAEGNLPELSDKEGIKLEMRDADSNQYWSFRYKFWSNNKSRMYVLENTGDFVKTNGVEMGDYLTIYEDESKKLYFSISKSGNQIGRREDELTEVNETNHWDEIFMRDDFLPKDEEDDSIAMLIGDLNDHYPIPNDLMGLTVDLDQHHQANSSFPPVDHVTVPQHVGSSNDHAGLNDFIWM